MKALYMTIDARHLGKTTKMVMDIIKRFLDGTDKKLNIEVTCPEILELQKENRKLLRIIEVQGEALKDMQRYECTSKELLAEHILILAKQAEEQVSKILTEQNEGKK